MKGIIFCLVLLFCVKVQAVEIKVATITTDVLDETTVFFIDVNPDGTAQGMHYVSTAASGQITDDVYSTLPEVLDGGVVLRVMEGREIVRLHLENFDQQAGGKVRLEYLVNGVTGTKNNHFLALKKTANSFILADTQGAEVNTIFVKGNWSRVLRRWIGVTGIQASYSAL
jgi:hypothetical protein